MGENIVASLTISSYAFGSLISKTPSQVFEEMVQNKSISFQKMAIFCCIITPVEDAIGFEIAYVGYWHNKNVTVLTRVPNTNQLTLVGMEQLDHIPSREEIDEIFKRHTAPQGEDEPLFQELGFLPYRIGLNEKHFVGKVRFDDGAWVKVWVKGLPAGLPVQVWWFEVYSHEIDETYHVKTGSGPLLEYWGFIRKIADGMIDVVRIE